MTLENQVQALRVQVDDLKAQVSVLTNDVADLGMAVTPPTSVSSPSQCLFATADEWVARYFAVVFVRPMGGEFRWCARWQEHPEAVIRFEALWRSWEAMRCEEPAGMATWLTSLLDPQLLILLGRAGPFATCNGSRHEQGVGSLTLS